MTSQLADPKSTPSQAAAQPPRAALTRRSVLLALLLIPLNAWWLVQTEFILYTDNATTAALFFNAVSLILVLLALNALIGRVLPRWKFAPAELVVIYVVVSVATNLAGHDQLQILFSSITYLARRAGPDDPWSSRILPHVPEFLLPPRGAALDALYRGDSTLYRWDHIQPWLAPLGWWTLFALLIVWVMLCLTAMLRKQWDAERLAYPIAEVPIQVILNADTLFRQPLFWGGAAIGLGGQALNLAHSLWPSIPTVTIGIEYYRFPDFPLNAAGQIPIATFPFALGLSFLLPLQIGFSVWFFFFLSRVEMVLAAMNGFTDANRFPYIRQQGVGAALGFTLIVLWQGRGHLVHVVRAALGLVRGRDDDEPMDYRLAFWGFLAGTGLLILFAVGAGMQPLTACYYFALLNAIVMVVARLRAEVGLPTFEFFRVGPEDILTRLGGSPAWSKADHGVMSIFFWLTRTHRQFPMQTQVDSFRLAHRARMPLGQMSVLILTASALGIVCAFWAMLAGLYETGVESASNRGPFLWAFGPEPWRRMDTLMQTPTPPDTGAAWAYGFGAAFVTFLSVMRARFVDWPFHPAGYVISGSFGLFRLWLPIFLAWLLKSLILRFGGLKGYRTALPFFIGLVIGEFAAGFARSLLDLLFGLKLPPGSGLGGL